MTGSCKRVSNKFAHLEAARNGRVSGGLRSRDGTGTRGLPSESLTNDGKLRQRAQGRSLRGGDRLGDASA